DQRSFLVRIVLFPTAHFRAVHKNQQCCCLPLPHFHTAKKPVHPSWWRFISPIGWIFPDLRSGGSCAVIRPAHPSASRQGAPEYPAAKPLGTTHDSTAAVAALSDNISAQD